MQLAFPAGMTVDSVVRWLQAGIALAMLQVLSPTQAVADAEVKFRFFDEDGHELDYSTIVDRMTNGRGKALLSEGVFDLDTLKVVTLNKSHEEEGIWTTAFPDPEEVPRQGLEVHWNTRNTGYSTFLLDNEGKGFTRSEVLIFNERLAYDSRRQLKVARSRRPDYRPSVSYRQLESRIESCFKDLAAAQTDSDKGRLGQTCVDRVAQAMVQLLSEYGQQRSKALGNEAVWGVTINPQSENPVSSDLTKVDDLVDLFEPGQRWARIIMDGEHTDTFERVQELVNYAASKQVKALGQLFDSTSQAEMSLDTFKERVDESLAHPDFNKFSAWEVGNEVNGQWLGDGMTEKIEYAAERVKSEFPGKMACLTFYWYSMQNSSETSLFNWIDAHVTPKIRENINCVALSIYINQQPLGFSWDLVMSKLSEIFPGKKVLVGEMGYYDPSDPSFYREGQMDLSQEDAARAYIRNRYLSAFATPQAYGGGFWWYYDQEMVGKTSLWEALRDTYCSVFCSGESLVPRPRH